jgi:hypothetical protein
MSDNLWAVDMEHGLLRSSKFAVCPVQMSELGGGEGGMGLASHLPKGDAHKVAHKLERFWAVQCLIIFGTAKLLPQKIRLPLICFFPTGCLSPPPFVFFSFSLLFFPPSNWGESFQNSNYPLSLVNLSQFTKPWGCEVADLGRWVNQHPGRYHGTATKFI